MISSVDLRNAIARLIKDRAGLPLRVYFNQVLDAEEDYAFVQFRPERTDEGLYYFQRRLVIDIQVVLSPLEAVVKHSELLDIADSLDRATHGYIEVADRKITVYKTTAHIFDDVLNFSFALDFTDYIESVPEELEQYETMQNLHLAKKREE